MTQVHPEFVDLTEIAARSGLVLVATPATPPARIELVSILPPGSQFEGKNVPPFASEASSSDGDQPRLDRNYPPYSRHWQAFEVSEVLKGDPALAGFGVEVRGADDATHFRGHVCYYVQGIGESPICETYRPSERPGLEEGRILFLCALPEGAGYEFVAQDSFEGLSRKLEVVELLAAGPPGISPD